MKRVKYMGLSLLLVLAGLSMTSCQKLVKALVDHAYEINAKAEHKYTDSEELGKVVTRDLQVEDFTELILTGSVRVEFTQDTLCGIQAYGNERVLDAYGFRAHGRKFRAVVNEDSSIARRQPEITLRVRAPRLTRLDVTGAVDFVQKTPITQTDKLEIEITGAGDVNLSDIHMSDLEVEVSGAGDLTMGKVVCSGDADISLVGVADVEGHVEARNVDLTVNGAGDGKLDVKCDELYATCIDAGDVSISGICKKREITGDDIDTSKLKVLK